MSWTGRAMGCIKQVTRKGCRWIRGRRAPTRSTDGGGDGEHGVEHAVHGFHHGIKEFFKFGRKREGESGDIRSGHVHLGAAIDSLDHPLKRSCWIDSGPAGDAAAGAVLYGPLGVRRPNAAAKLRYNPAKRTFEYMDVPPAGAQGATAAESTSAASETPVSTTMQKPKLGKNTSDAAATGGGDHRVVGEHGGAPPTTN